jgi:hypothetical protein
MPVILAFQAGRMTERHTMACTTSINFLPTVPSNFASNCEYFAFLSPKHSSMAILSSIPHVPGTGTPFAPRRPSIRLTHSSVEMVWTAAEYRADTAHIACKSEVCGKLGWVGGSRRRSSNVGRWISRDIEGTILKNTCTLSSAQTHFIAYK